MDISTTFFFFQMIIVDMIKKKRIKNCEHYVQKYNKAYVLKKRTQSVVVPGSIPWEVPLFGKW